MPMKKKPTKAPKAAKAKAAAAAKGANKVPVRPDQELKKLALEYTEGKIFGSWNIHETDQKSVIGMVFMPITFMLKKDLPEDIAHVYAYMHEAGPRSINGYPMFYSCYMLNEADYKKFVEYVNKIRKQREEFLNDEKPESNSNGAGQPAGN